MPPRPSTALACAALCLALASPALGAKRRSTETWEHKCLELEWSRPEEIDTFADGMGLASWQLVGFPKPKVMCFKRRRVDADSPVGKLRALSDRMSKLIMIYNAGRMGEEEFKKRLAAIEAERDRLLAIPEGP